MSTPAEQNAGADRGSTEIDGTTDGTAIDRTALGGTALDGTALDNTSEISYERARNELREIVHALESGGQPLEESLALWQRGEQLAAICQHWLEGARTRLDAAIAASEARHAADD